MRRELRGRRMLITGASSGIGRALAEQAANDGCRLILAARSHDRLEELANRLTAKGADVVTVAADVTSADDRCRLEATVQERFGGLDVLVNNAGVCSFGHFASGTEEILRAVMEVNFFAPAELIRLFVPMLKNGVQPAVVNVSSMCGRRGMPAWPEYSASKFALSGLTEALSGELGIYDIDVLLIVPGLTQSELRNNMLRNDGRMKIEDDKGMKAEDVAVRILKAIRGNWRETVLGGEAKWILRINRWFPRLVDWLSARKVRKLYAAQNGSSPNCR